MHWMFEKSSSIFKSTTSVYGLRKDWNAGRPAPAAAPACRSESSDVGVGIVGCRRSEWKREVVNGELTSWLVTLQPPATSPTTVVNTSDYVGYARLTKNPEARAANRGAASCTVQVGSYELHSHHDSTSFYGGGETSSRPVLPSRSFTTVFAHP